MIRRTQPRKRGGFPNAPSSVPSPARIRQLAAEIRQGWSPKTYRRRAAEGAGRVELMIVSASELDGILQGRDE